ncbi:PLD nuclease N-terminal domain-containing protein [Williamsia sp.]|uniref:PLD nuclease N-terminal domain-containing protein n=1 Tax=Williamsia sp. TaxID=1872085 RepID=UPI001A2B7F84|nr:PLD nuclease N-terminal domain-containing protein [Williamsia sp.]MBJ7287417.1 PLDc_N domain-containing protein [Williamsia sp.]
MPYLAVIYVLIIVVVLVDIVVTDGRTVRGVPKPVWALLSMALPLVGPIAWLALGRPQKDESQKDGSQEHDAQKNEKTRATSGSVPEMDAETQAALFAAQVRERAEQQRRIAREQRDR